MLGPQRKNLLNIVYKQHCTKQRVNESYRKLKNAFKKLHDDYLHIKGRNIFTKYMQMQQMICEVIILEKQYWQLINVPTPEPSEAVKDYVTRVMELVNVTQLGQIRRSGIATLLGVTTIADGASETIMLATKRSLSSSDLRNECDRMYITLYRLLRKYLKLREMLKELSSSFHFSRFLPIIPRYNLLKSMIKNVIREPTFAEIYHEPDV
uniref:NR LBD domain-containing protein n=1 Tax=Elaeophora elaphi TaxID=1147741 RepID=A0A0R3S190_9BILA